LLPTRQRDEEAQLDEFWLSKMCMELCPEFVVRDPCIPKYGACVTQGGFLPFVISIRALEFQEVVVIVF